MSEGARPFQWSPDVVRRLAEDAAWALTSNPAGAAEVAGLLLGKCSSGVEILDCRPVFLMREQDHAYALAGPGRREFERAIAWFRSIPDGELCVVGFYRTHMDSQLALTEEDLGLLRTCFRDTSQVTLLLNVSSDQSYSAKLFSGDNGQIVSDFHASEDATGLPVWLDLWQNLSPSDAADTSSTPQAPGSPETAVLAEPVELAQPPLWETQEEQEGPVTPKRRSLRIPLFLVAAAALLGALVGYPMLKQSAKLRQEADTSGPSITVQPDSSIKSGLALCAEKHGDDLVLDWNRAAPIITAASGAILTIREANKREKQVMLDANLLKNGSVVYRPVDNSVFLRLVVFNQGGATLGESATTYPPAKSGAASDPEQGH